MVLLDFFRLYEPLADSWTLCDNSGDKLVIVGHDGKGVDPTILVQECFDTIRDQADHAA